MPGSLTPAVTRPRPLRLAVRLLVAAALVLFPVVVLQRLLVEPLLPVFKTVIGVLDQQFVITDARVDREGPDEVMLFQANLKQPTKIAGHLVYPFGWYGVPPGGYQVTCAPGGVLLYSAVLIIIALSWPASRVREVVVRVPLCLLFVALLLLIDVPTTVVAELRHSVETLVDPHALSGWMIWSRFLMGGGGIALSVLLAVIAISAGRWYARLPQTIRLQ
jgi:hypothetical protein